MNENKFTGLADVYAKHRPKYAIGFIEYLYSDLGFSDESVIADIGSGTGIFTELMLLRDSKVFAVEPNEDMRKTAETNFAHFAKFISVSGSAENTGLSNKACDFITVAQAFHWFDRLLFKQECKRILKPNGKIIIIYNIKDSKSSLVIENEEINKQYCPNFKGFSGGMANTNPEEFKDFFGGGICDFKAFENDLIYDEQGFIGRALSASYSLKENDKNYNAYIAALKSLFQKYSTNGKIRLPNITASFIGEV